MNKKVLNKATNQCKDEIKNALQTVFDTLNTGQKNKIIKDEEVKRIFDLYGVDYN